MSALENPEAEAPSDVAVYEPLLEQLTAWATSEERQPEVLAARAEFFAVTGEAHEDDPSFELRLASFVDYFLFDRPLSGGATPAEAFVGALPDEERAAYYGFARTVHGLFEVRKVRDGAVDLREPFSGQDFSVHERRRPAGLEKGDLIEARLLPFEGHMHFSRAFTFHPRSARKPILREVKRLRSAGEARTPREFLWALSRMALKAERYRGIAMEKIYAF